MTLEFTPSAQISPQGIEQEITQSYIEYAMSVIVSRALPDTRDGLKPVIRRILYTMYEMKLFHNTKYKKSMGVVGQTLRDYHPHGDSSVYQAMVRLAQPFSMRYPLVDGQGNFGSIDGDGAAAARYTEARLTSIAEGMLDDIELDTVDWRPNYDNSRQEPVMLPTRFPNHLCNGTMGIAVGMATNMAPHNLTEVIDASLLVLSNPEANISEIMEFIKGPDFPGGGIIYGSEYIKEVYAKGRGSITCRAKIHIEPTKLGQQIIVTELPYNVNKSRVVETIAELVSEKKIEGISDILDESAKGKIRISIDIKKGFDLDTILTQLYKYTELQTNFSVNNITLIEGGTQPSLLNIKDLIVEFVTFRREVVLRRSIYLLKKAEDRLHILEGLKRAVDIIDAIIALIRGSQTTEEAKNKLMYEYDFSDVQADYILALRLSRLVGLEIQKILEEIGDKNQTIAELTEIINNPVRRDQVVSDELQDIKKKYGDERRTEVCDDVNVADLSGNMKQLKKLLDKKKEDVIFISDINHGIKVVYQTRIQVIPEDTLEMLYTHNQDHLIVITDIGELVVQRLKDLGQFTPKSQALDPKSHWGLKGNIVLCSTVEADYEHLVFLTSQNSLKKISKELVLSFKKFPTVIMGLDDGEKIINVSTSSDSDHFGIVSKNGNLLLFKSEEVRPMGKTAGGIKAIELDDDDAVAGMFVYQDEPFVIVYSTYAAKLLNVEDMKFSRRARKGQSAAILKKGEYLIGGGAIGEGSLRIKLSNGEIKTVLNDVMKLDDLDTPLEPVTQVGIEMVYIPWEEKEKAKKAKPPKEEVVVEEKKDEGLFEVPTDE